MDDGVDKDLAATSLRKHSHHESGATDCTALHHAAPPSHNAELTFTSRLGLHQGQAPESTSHGAGRRTHSITYGRVLSWG